MAKPRKKWKLVECKSTLGGAVDDAMSEVQSLRDEMNEWRDNLEERLSNTPKYEEVSEACDALEQVADEEPQIPGAFPTGLTDEVVFHQQMPYGRRAPSRQTRLDGAIAALREVNQVVTTFVDDHEESDKVWGEGGATLHDEWEQYASDVDQIATELEGVSFPGMY